MQAIETGGGPLPPFVLEDLNSGQHKLTDYQGKVVGEFLGYLGPPCVKEMPSMQRLKSKLDGEPFVILAT